MKPLKVFIVCSGLGRIKRGYESFLRECFDILQDDTSINLYLFKGHGKSSKKERTVPNLHRNSSFSKFIGKLIGKGSYSVEQITFFIFLLPYLLIKKPDIVYLSDIVLGNLIYKTKVIFKLKYKIVYKNGGPISPKFFYRWDLVQQVAPKYLADGIEFGVPDSKQLLLPNAVNLKPVNPGLTHSEKIALKRELELPINRDIILSVGAINDSRKRMSYVINEVANLPHPRPYLQLLGQIEHGSLEIIQLGEKLLGNDNFDARMVTKSVVKKYYQVADIFTLASLDEGFGFVYVEAISHGLPCIVHDYEISRFILDKYAIYGDLREDGNLAKLIENRISSDETNHSPEELSNYIYNRFSWDVLRPEYIAMFEKASQLPD